MRTGSKFRSKLTGRVAREMYVSVPFLFWVLHFSEFHLQLASGSQNPDMPTFELTWEEVKRNVPLVKDEGTAETSITYMSSAIQLDPGRVVLTPPSKTPIPMPPQPFLLRGLHVEVVYPNGQPVPLTEVYLHHIAFYDGVTSADLCGGASLEGKDALWSVGAESRHTSTFFPDGYGYPVLGNSSDFPTQWSANIHIIRTKGVPHVSSAPVLPPQGKPGRAAGRPGPAQRWGRFLRLGCSPLTLSSEDLALSLSRGSGCSAVLT